MAAVPPSTLVLLEGPSDVAALEAVLTARGAEVRGTAYRLVDMGGVTNTAAHLRRAVQDRGDGEAPRVLGLCDAGEAWVVVRALRDTGREVEEEADLAAHGFFVCDRDLEDELVRALGVRRCLALLEAEGLGHRFRAFSAQRAWAERPVEERLRRFSGIASGRKIRLARAMAAALPPAEVPLPIARLVARIEHVSASGGRHHEAIGAGGEECPP
jgi:hypothetical protein